MNIHYLTQLDYIKILLEEDRNGEALNHLRSITSDLEAVCKSEAERLNTELEMTKAETKTKPENWIYVNNTWAKLIEIDSDVRTIALEVSKGISIKTTFKINGTTKTPVGQ